MDDHDAVTLLRSAVHTPGGTWADLGAGTGTFTRALAALLGRGGRVYAIDRDRRAIEALRDRSARRATESMAAVTPLLADFRQPLPPFVSALDGVLLANALHFVDVAEQGEVLTRVTCALRRGGRLVLVEYEGRRPSRWVPFSVSLARFHELAPRAGLSAPTPVGSLPSAFGGSIYAAVATRP